MRALLSEPAERGYCKLFWTAWIIFPVEILLLYSIVFTATWWWSFLLAVPLVINTTGCFLYCMQRIMYRRRIKGNDRMWFMFHYHQLYTCSCLCNRKNQDDRFIRMTVQVKRMADIMEVDFSVALNFAFQHAGTFLGPVKGLPLRLPDVPDWAVVLRVLSLDVKDLPMYITHRDALVRKTAIYRVACEKIT